MAPTRRLPVLAGVETRLCLSRAARPLPVPLFPAPPEALVTTRFLLSKRILSVRSSRKKRSHEANRSPEPGKRARVEGAGGEGPGPALTKLLIAPRPIWTGAWSSPSTCLPLSPPGTPAPSRSPSRWGTTRRGCCSVSTPLSSGSAAASPRRTPTGTASCVGSSGRWRGGPANGTWGCGDGPAAAAAIRDFASYPDQHRRFVLHAGCRSFPLLVNQPHKCAGNGTFLLLAIKSVPGNFAARQAVRETWGREGAHGGQPVRTIFLMGAAHGPHQPDLRRLIAAESQAYGDVLVWDFEDTFFNLTLKDFLFLGWALAHCPDARFVLKGDDDVFINTPRVLAYLGALDTRRARTLYTGQVMANASPFRQASSKYYIPESFYAGPYPAYAGGGGYIFSGRLAPALFLLAQHVAFYPIDDVYTGLCFQALGVRAEAHPEFQTFDIAEKDRADPCAHRQLLLVHRRSPPQTMQLWLQLRDPQLKC
ncbi:UDP-GlcNAc:betaGal beta-1,3-N-acetylglucosaminyltransferase 8 [Eretmochelys imbricata]